MFPLDFSKARIVWLAAPAIFCLAFPAPDAARAQTSASGTAASTTTSASGTSGSAGQQAAPKSADLVETLNAALTQAKTVLISAQADRDKALKIINSIPASAPKDADLDADPVKRLKDIAQLLSDQQVTQASLKKLEDSLRQDAGDKTGLSKAKQDLKPALSAVTASIIDSLATEDAKKAAKELVSDAAKTLADCDATLKDIQDNAIGAGALGDETKKTRLHTSVEYVYSYAGGLFTALKSRLDTTGLPALAADANADKVRSTLVSNLGAETTMETLRSSLSDAWGKLAATLQDVLAPADRKEGNVTDVEAAFDADEKKTAVNFEAWLTVLLKDVLAEGDTVKTSSLELKAALDKKPRDEDKVITAPARLNAARAKVADVTLIVKVIPDLLDALKKRSLATGNAADKVTALKNAADTLATQGAILDEVLSGDRERFVQDQMRLFYFTDVPRLLYALNKDGVLRNDPTGSDKLKEDFNAKRKELLDAEDGVVEANAKINAAAQQLIAIQEDLRRTTAQLAKADSDTQGAQSRLASLNRLQDLLALRKTSLTTRLNNLTKQQADAGTAKQTAQAQSLQNQISQTQEQIDRANTQSDQQQKIVTQVTQQQNDLKDQQSTLKQQVTSFQAQQADARQKLVDMQTTQARNRIQAQRLSQDEVQGFGDANEHGAFYYTEPIGSSTDPVKRVMFIGYDDSKVIFIRGLPKDVERVKEIIAGYDRPAPQARVTLWTLQLNGTDLNALNRALKSVEDNLRTLRGQVISIQDILRDSINEEVSRVGQFAIDNTNLIANAPEQERARLARYFYYAPEVRQALGFPFLLNKATQDHSPVFPGKMHRVPEFQDYAAAADLTRWTLPDPAHATTLGEMLFVLSLGKNSSRFRIIHNFLDRIAYTFGNSPLPLHPRDYEKKKPTPSASSDDQNRTYSQNAIKKIDPNLGQSAALSRFAQDMRSIHSSLWPNGLTPHSNQTPNPPDLKPNPLDPTWDFDTDVNVQLPPDFDALRDKPVSTSTGFPAFPRMILGSSQFVSNEGLNANQLEILTALQAKAKGAVGAEMRRLLSQIDALEVRSDKEIKTGVNKRYDPSESLLLREQYLPLLGWLQSKAFKSSSDKLDEDFSYYQLGLKASGRNPATVSIRKLPWYELKAMDLAAMNHINLAQQRYSLAEATPRVAAADDMIKRMIIVTEDDLDYYFVAPMLNDLRRIANAKIQLGVLNRESMLVTNRQVSRLDPRGSANLNLANGTDFLQEATQLGQLVAGAQEHQRFRDEQRREKLQTTLPLLGEGIASRLGETAVNSLAVGGLLSLFGDLAAKPQEPGGEIYSLNTGSLFQITPIFDPSGQALRFNLNYQAGTRVQSQLGTTTPDLPNIDRHSINTEVQITNLEFREISTFEANSKIGTPELRTGGIPIIKDLPVIRDIPVLGYFFRRRAQAGARQESVLFAQTSLYPTIGDIVDVLSDVPLRFDINSETPDYLKPEPIEEKKPDTPAAVLSALSFDPASPVAGSPTVGTVTLSAPASENVTVTITADKNGDMVIAHPDTQTIVIPKGQTSALFALKTVPNIKGTVPISASVKSTTKIALLTVKSPDEKPEAPAPPAIAGLNFDAPTVVGGAKSITGTVTLAADAPSEGATITLKANGATLEQNTVMVPAKQRTATFKITAAPVDTSTAVIVTATSGKTAATSAFIIVPPRLTDLLVKPANNGADYTFVVVLDGEAASNGRQVRIYCKDTPYLAFDEVITVPAGQRQAQITRSPQKLPTGVKPPQIGHVTAAIARERPITKKVAIVR